MEKKEVIGTGSYVMSIMEGRRADVEEEDDNEYGAEGDEDEEEGGDEEEEAAEYGAEDYGEETEEFPGKDRVPHVKAEDRFFIGDQKLRQKYSEVEIGAFMKLLNVKPHRQWEDTSTYHYKLG